MNIAHRHFCCQFQLSAFSLAHIQRTIGQSDIEERFGDRHIRTSYIKTSSGKGISEEVASRHPHQPNGCQFSSWKEQPDRAFKLLGKARILIGIAIAKSATSIIMIGLPIVQVIVLVCVYIALPIAVPFATLRLGLLVFFISALFSLKFLTALWALSKFIAARMIDYMYGKTGILIQWDINDLVLTIITSLSYVGLPVVWLSLKSSFACKGSRA